MSVATVLTRTPLGLDAPLVRVEVHLGGGLPQLSIVGLAETAVRESKDRVRAALATARFEVPDGRITVSLAPADLPKEGSRFDLAVALGVLVASGQLPAERLARSECYGELSLTGELRPVSGLLPAAIQAVAAGHRLIVPRANLAEAACVRDLEIATAGHLLEVTAELAGAARLDTQRGSPPVAASRLYGPDLADVRGQAGAKRALEIAAAGEHSLLFIGPPGAGKSLLAQRLPSLLPPPDDDEALEIAALQALRAGRGERPPWGQRPFRSPHHSASVAALVGGGTVPRPGEVSLAHRGVLFLDELPEFERHALETLREPLETRLVTISRAGRQATFPAQFQLIAAMNPCPCGYAGDGSGRCRCTRSQVERYLARLSGPLIDRIDLHVGVLPVTFRELSDHLVPMEASAVVAQRVAAARARQQARQGSSNAALEPRQLARVAEPDAAGRQLLERAAERLGLSARACHRVLKVARTIADLAAAEQVAPAHVAEAITYRQLDRTLRTGPAAAEA